MKLPQMLDQAQEGTEIPEKGNKRGGSYDHKPTALAAPPRWML